MFYMEVQPIEDDLILLEHAFPMDPNPSIFGLVFIGLKKSLYILFTMQHIQRKRIHVANLYWHKNRFSSSMEMEMICNVAVTPSRKSHVKQFWRNGVERCHLVVVTGSLLQVLCDSLRSFFAKYRLAWLIRNGFTSLYDGALTNLKMSQNGA